MVSSEVSFCLSGSTGDGSDRLPPPRSLFGAKKILLCFAVIFFGPLKWIGGVEPTLMSSKRRSGSHVLVRSRLKRLVLIGQI